MNIKGRHVTSFTIPEIEELVKHAELTLSELKKSKKRRVYSLKSWEDALWHSCHRALGIPFNPQTQQYEYPQ